MFVFVMNNLQYLLLLVILFFIYRRRLCYAVRRGIHAHWATPDLLYKNTERKK